MSPGTRLVAIRRRAAAVPVPLTAPMAGTATRGPGWHEALVAFKRCLVAGALSRSGGNRTRAARSLGLQRTYLLRLMRTLGVSDAP